jgi:hypothetical protein
METRLVSYGHQNSSDFVQNPLQKLWILGNKCFFYQTLELDHLYLNRDNLLLSVNRMLFVSI